MNRNWLGALAAAALLAGCGSPSTDQADWQSARQANTVEAYKQYLEAHPDGEHVKQARTQLKEVRREEAWARASEKGTAGALRKFLEKYPEGPEADLARAKLAELEADKPARKKRDA